MYDMGCYSLEESWEMLNMFFQTNECFTQTVRNFKNRVHPMDYCQVSRGGHLTETVAHK